MIITYSTQLSDSQFCCSWFRITDFYHESHWNCALSSQDVLVPFKVVVVGYCDFGLSSMYIYIVFLLVEVPKIRFNFDNSLLVWALKVYFVCLSRLLPFFFCWFWSLWHINQGQVLVEVCGVVFSVIVIFLKRFILYTLNHPVLVFILTLSVDVERQQNYNCSSRFIDKKSCIFL